MPFEELKDFLDFTPSLPIGGKTYRVPPLPAEKGLRFQAVKNAALARASGVPATAGDLEALAGGEPLDIVKDSLGSAHQAMVDDDVPWPIIEHAGITAYVFWTQGRTAAELYWAGPGKARTPRPPETPPSTAAGTTTS